MTNFNERHQSEPPAAPAGTSRPQRPSEEDDAADRARWRRIGRVLAYCVEARADALYDITQAEGAENNEDGATEKPNERQKPGDDALVRKISALVIAAQRSMEMEHSCNPKTSRAGDAPLSDAAIEKLLEFTEAEIDAFREFVRTRRAAAAGETVGGDVSASRPADVGGAQE